jgi:bifunctional enzyme CysN/CysC
VLTQTRRHTFIATLLGIKHIIVAINKMDLVDYSEKIYLEIKNDYGKFSSRLDIGEVRYLPISALKGDNVVNKSDEMPWYEGAPLMTVLENIQISSDRNLTDFRFPVQYVNRPNLDFRGYCGTVASGIVKKGDEVMVLPSRKTSTIKSIVTYDGEINEAFPPLAVTLTLEDEIDISRGDMLVRPNNAPYLSDKVDAHIVWMSEQPMQPGKHYSFKQATRKTTGSISNIRFKIDVNTLDHESADQLLLNEIGRCEITLSQRIAFDAYKTNPGTGAFIVIDRLTNVTVGAGMIVGTVSENIDSNWESKTRSELLKPSDSLVTAMERQTRLGQKPKTMLLTGLTGSGKSTIAYALERKLFDLGRSAIVLDGQNMRLGPSKDLGFDAAARSENLRRSIEIAKLVNQTGIIAICSFVAPSEEVRKKARDSVGDDFIEVYLSAPLDVCRLRDQEGIYEAIESDGLETVPGVNLPFEEPSEPDVVLPTHEISVDDCVERLIKVLEERGAF